jgi:hypothetical protein
VLALLNPAAGVNDALGDQRLLVNANLRRDIQH